MLLKRKKQEKKDGQRCKLAALSLLVNEQTICSPDWAAHSSTTSNSVTAHRRRTKREAQPLCEDLPKYLVNT